MKLPKFVNKKMIIFVVLFIAFIYFSGILHYMREGLTPGVKTIKDMDCSGCGKSGNNPRCNTKCPKLKYNQIICEYNNNGKYTVCREKPKNIKNIKNPNKLTKPETKK